MKFKFFFTIFIAIILLSVVLTVQAGTLSCVVRTNSCNGGEVNVFKMSSLSNAHAGFPGSSYSNLVCCSGVTNLGTSCFGTYDTVLKLSKTPSNAHVEKNTQNNYVNNVCLSVPSGASVSVGYQADNCAGFDTTIASMQKTTNSHVGDVSAYATKICATAANVVPVVSVSVSDGVVSYGTMAAGTSKSTVDLSDMQFITNNGTVTETFNIKGQNTDCPWTLSATVGSDQYVHKFCNEVTGSDCVSPPANYTTLTTSYQTFGTGVIPSGALNLDLQITVPNPSSCSSQQSVDVMIQAVQE